MNKEHCLRAGSGTAVINIDDTILPLDGFTYVRNPLHVRAIVLESNIRVVIVSVEITTLPEEVMEEMVQKVCAIAGVEREQVWLTLAHSFGGPHIWPEPKPGETEKPRPGRKPRTQDDIARCARLREAYYAALEQAVTEAVGGMRPAVMGAGRGTCTVNISRNLETREGWWLGGDSEEPCDHALTVLRIDAADGTPIAMMFHYGVRACVMMKSKAPDGGGIITSELCGVAGKMLEQELGDRFTVLFLCGAAADQEPQLTTGWNETDKDGVLRSVDFGEIGGALLDAQATRLAAETRKVWRRTQQLRDVEEFRMGSRAYVCATKKMTKSGAELQLSRDVVFEPDGEMTLTAYALRLGVMNLIGVQPEIDGLTSIKLAQSVPGELTAAAIQVNGSGKCMPEQTAYDQIKYQSVNSPFMPGGAETMCAAAAELLRSL